MYKVQSVEDQQKFAVPLNSATETLFYNHRMIIDSNLYNADSECRAWLISKVNRISPDNIVRVTLAQDTYNQHSDYIERDEFGNIIGKWADYYKSHIVPSFVPDDDVPSSLTSVITCSGKQQIKVGGSAKTFTLTYYDETGEVPHDPGLWEIFVDGKSAPELLEITTIEDGSKIKIKFLGDDSYIGKVLLIKNTYQDVVATLQIEITAL